MKTIKVVLFSGILVSSINWANANVGNCNPGEILSAQEFRTTFTPQRHPNEPRHLIGSERYPIHSILIRGAEILCNNVRYSGVDLLFFNFTSKEDQTVRLDFFKGLISKILPTPYPLPSEPVLAGYQGVLLTGKITQFNYRKFNSSPNFLDHQGKRGIPLDFYTRLPEDKDIWPLLMRDVTLDMDVQYTKTYPGIGYRDDVTLSRHEVVVMTGMPW